jgi:hypothetical protein
MVVGKRMAWPRTPGWHRHLSLKLAASFTSWLPRTRHLPDCAIRAVSIGNPASGGDRESEYKPHRNHCNSGSPRPPPSTTIINCISFIIIKSDAFDIKCCWLRLPSYGERETDLREKESNVIKGSESCYWQVDSGDSLLFLPIGAWIRRHSVRPTPMTAIFLSIQSRL